MKEREREREREKRERERERETDRQTESIKQYKLHIMFLNEKVKKKNCCELCSDYNIVFSSSNVTTSRIPTCYTISVLLELVKSFRVYNVILNFDK